MDQRISLITLGYRDYRRARGFYAAMGWTNAVAPDDEVVFFQAGGMIFALWDRAKLAADSGAVQDAGGWGGVTLAYCVASPEAVDEVLARAKASGGSVPREGGTTFWGGYSGIFVDPEGHPWEVAHNPGWTLNDDGTISLS
jgi:uncharacterized protein